MLTNKKIAFIGSGMMAEAMIKALLREKLVQPQDVLAAGPRAERGRELEKRYGVNWTTDNREADKDRDGVILSDKPHALGQVLSDLRGLIAAAALVPSIAAGVPIHPT